MRLTWRAAHEFFRLLSAIASCNASPKPAPETRRWTSANPPATLSSAFSTRAIHYGCDPAKEHGALTPPIVMTSTYAFESAEAGRELFRGERAGFIYGRTRNPTQALLEAGLARLEGGSRARVRNTVTPYSMSN
jgi:hypothetical protein